VQSVTNNTALVTTTNFTAAGAGVAGYVSAVPKLTIQSAINATPTFIAASIAIYVAPGTYNEVVRIADRILPAGLNLYGATSATNTHICTRFELGGCYGYIGITGFNANTSGGSYVQACSIGNCRASVNVLYCVFDGSATTDGFGLNALFSDVWVYGCTISNKKWAVNCNTMAFIRAGTLAGTNNGVGYNVGYGGLIAKQDNTMMTATTPEAYTAGGLIVGSTGGKVGTS
jgi:hypothetical protein